LFYIWLNKRKVRTDGSSLMIELLVVSAPNACLFMISWVWSYSAFVWSFKY
jgi:hypothetical protein